MEKVLVSACLMGDRVRYNGVVKTLNSHILEHWHRQGYVVTICPEVAGGLPVPRSSAEIFHGDGSRVLTGHDRVINIKGKDVTQYFLDGAHKSLEIAFSSEIKIAVLKEGSPSCGSSYIYDGSFSGNKKPGKGVTTAILGKNGIRVFSEREIPEAEKYLKVLENTKTFKVE